MSVRSAGRKATRISDLDLLRRVKSGEQEAFGVVIRQHQGRLLRLVGRFVASHEDAEDVVQETFITAYRQIGRFRGDASLATWLSRIAIYQALRLARRRKPLVTDSYKHPPDSSHQADATDVVAVREAVAGLPEKLRVPVVLRFWEDLSGREIAEMLGWQQSTVWTRLYRGLARLKGDLGGDETA